MMVIFSKVNHDLFKECEMKVKMWEELSSKAIQHHRPIRISFVLAKEWMVKELSQSTSVRTRSRD